MNNIDEYISEFFSFSNPVIYSFIFSAIIVAVVLLIFFKVVYPMKYQFILEKDELEIKHAKLMALFAELDNNPLIRIDNCGKIIQTNVALRNLFEGVDLQTCTIEKLLTATQIDCDEIIKNNLEIHSFETIREKIFSVVIKGNSAFNFANIYMHDITKLKEYESLINDYKNKLKKLADTLEYKLEAEKRFISSELHDDIGQRLILLKLKLLQLNETASREDIINELDQIYSKVRSISRALKPLEIEELGLKFAIQSLVKKVSDGSGIMGYFTYLGSEERLHQDIELCIYRNIQESLNNILKHSNANEFAVQVINSKEYLDIIISDDGKGIPEEYFLSKDLKDFGIGLFGMQERVENLDGTFRINSEPGQGTSIVIKLPKKGELIEEDSVTYS
ncbi:MAG: ATP-binding protein [Bacteroidota bacterium]